MCLGASDHYRSGSWTCLSKTQNRPPDNSYLPSTPANRHTMRIYIYKWNSCTSIRLLSNLRIKLNWKQKTASIYFIIFRVSRNRWVSEFLLYSNQGWWHIKRQRMWPVAKATMNVLPKRWREKWTPLKTWSQSSRTVLQWSASMSFPYKHSLSRLELHVTICYCRSFCRDRGGGKFNVKRWIRLFFARTQLQWQRTHLPNHRIPTTQGFLL